MTEGELRRIRGREAEVDGDVLLLGEALEHSFEGKLPPDPALLDPATRLAEHLDHPLVDLHPAGVDPVGGPEQLPDVARLYGFGGARWPKRGAAHSLVANRSTRTVRSLVSVISRT